MLDSVGVGSMPDAGRFKDEGANTLFHLFQQRGSLEIPNLCSLGLGKIVDIQCKSNDIIGCYGKMAERSPNKDTTSGHWELAATIHVSRVCACHEETSAYICRSILLPYCCQVRRLFLAMKPCHGLSR